MAVTFNLNDWLPVTRDEISNRGWDEPDVIIISGDAYVDHPSFGHAVIGRIIEQEGFRVALVPQPNWKDDLRDFKKLGKPRLFFGVTAGSMDSMVNHYTANKRLRSDDAYTPGGKAGFRPDYATIVYTKILKSLYPDTPVVIGGIEASLRRFVHYDYWSDKLMKPILMESGADLLLYGMGEQPLRQLLKLLGKNIPFQSIRNIPQTAFLINDKKDLPVIEKWKQQELFSFDQCEKDKKNYALNFRKIEEESNLVSDVRFLQKAEGKLLVVNPPFSPMTEKEMDASFDLPYTRLPHPKYIKKPAIPAYEMIKYSINLHRGCFGGCSFCTISAHQGKFISGRSERSIMNELEKVTQLPGFSGQISDLGGPSANMYKMAGIDKAVCDKCRKASCIYPAVCNNLNTDHTALIEIYRKVASHPLVKKATIGSGIRYDLFRGTDKEKDKKYSHSLYAEELIRNHVSGRLKVAPEHSSEEVLKLMRKPSFRKFMLFKKFFDETCRKYGLNQHLIPYFISAHPGCSLVDMAELALATKDIGFRPEQVQGFTPSPMTLSTVMYYTSLHPYTLKPLKTARTIREKQEQNVFFFWYKKELHAEIFHLLKSMQRQDIAEELLGKRSSGKSIKMKKEDLAKEKEKPKFSKQKSKKRRR
jgi:uncharacterized radical SAM protein YgiQ